eukprot:CAMPEP_0119125044 /NCGR_PEP_ID=MMETSP1310-20130426/4451_1 /TAXON_ID=464262 /ORGANISM="Genus nov. species nov., Strain RCC2339" /LENGTH=521 /DNA_ID=CAMNT_0007115067 /DNA_START=137 /DNA_END=1705 /DNA_ORIENTATION=-
MVAEKAKETGVTKCISILTGDFLAPYLLSSVDKGKGMMAMLNQTPIDYVIWGNHEDDLEYAFVCQRTKEYKGQWINTNMQGHATFKETQKAYEIITITSEDGKHSRRIGLIGILSNSPALYRSNAFGGAKIEDPWETMEQYNRILYEQEKCDLVIPLCHLYVPQDKVTCERFPYPVVLSGHDHHVVDEVYFGSRLLKAGADGKRAVILDVSWDNPDQKDVTVEAEVVKTSNWKPDPVLAKTVERAYSVLDYLKNTQLSTIPQEFRPLSSAGSRERICSMGTLLCTLAREALCTDDNDESSVECVLLAGGDIRGGFDYPDDSFFSMESLKNEVQEKFAFVIAPIPGHVIAEGIPATHYGPNPGYLHFDNGVKLEDGVVVSIGGQPVEKDRLYRTALSLWDMQDGSSEPIKDYFRKHPELIPPEDACYPLYSSLISKFARDIWKRVFDIIDKDHDGEISLEEFLRADLDGDGRISADELKNLLRKAGTQIDDADAEFVHAILRCAGDANDDGYLSAEEMGIKD